MSEDRFVVTAIGGYTIRPTSGATRTSHGPTVSYSVIDTLAGCIEVGKFYADGRRGYIRKREADHLCAELNALEAEYEALHGG